MGDPITAADLERLLQNSGNRWLTRQEAGDYMGVSRETIRVLLNAGHLEPHRPTPGTMRLDKLQIDAYMRSKADSATQVRRRKQC